MAFDAIGGESSSTLYEAMPPVSSTYVYGRLGGVKESDDLYRMSTPQKSFDFFHLKLWLEEVHSLPLSFLHILDARFSFVFFSFLGRDHAQVSCWRHDVTLVAEGVGH